MNTEEFQNIEKTPEELAEEQKKMEEFYQGIFIQSNKGYFAKIQDYLNRKDITIQEAIEEVKDKKSGLSKYSRELLLGIKPELLEKWFPKSQNLRRKHANNRI